MNPITINKNLLFSDVWSTSEEFVADYRASGLNVAAITDTNLTVLYCQLFARHGSDHIRSNNSNQWKYKVFAIIFNKGPKWQAALLKQTELQNLTDEELTFLGRTMTNQSGNTTVVNEGGTITEDALDTVDKQDVNITRGNKLVAIRAFIDSLQDVSSAFISEFDQLFSRVVFAPDTTLYDMNEEEEE